MTNSIKKDALLSQFSELAYKGKAYLGQLKKLPQGWRLVAHKLASAFAAFAFKNDASGEVVIAYRGTDGLKDAGVGLAILTGNWHPQFQKGMNFVKSVIDDRSLFAQAGDTSKLLVSGHSLGGTIAQIVAQAYGLDGAAMDPGAAARITKTEGYRQAVLAAGLPESGVGISAAFTNHLVAGSLVSGSGGDHLGTVTYLPSPRLNSQQALTTLALGALNPLAGFVYLAGVDQVGNKHAAEQISQTLHLLADMDVGRDSGLLTMTPKIVRTEFDDLTFTDKPVFSQTEFDLRDSAGNSQGSVKFSGLGLDRKLAVFDTAGNPEVTVSRAPGGGSIENMTAASGTIHRTVDDQGSITAIENLQDKA